MVDDSTREGFRSFRVDVRGQAHWTVVGGGYERHLAADAYLTHLGFGAGAAESTVRAYAGDIALFLTWMAPRHDLFTAATHLASFMAWLRVTPIAGGRRSAGRPRSPHRQVRILVAVREFYKFAAAEHFVDASVLAALYQVADDRHLPAHLSVEGAGLGYVARPRHRVKLDRRASQEVCAPEEFEAMLRAARNWRDRFLLVLLWFTGLRIGQALGLCREDLHLARSSRELGCVHEGAHLHVVRRDNANGARSKSRQENVIPVDEFVLLYFERYHALRGTIRGARENPLLFVNVAKNPGSGMTPGYADALFQRLCVRAGIRRIHPHMFRHAFATNVRAGGAPLDVVQALLGHQSIHSTLIYNHTDQGQLRAAIAAVPVPSNGR